MFYFVVFLSQAPSLKRKMISYGFMLSIVSDCAEGTHFSSAPVLLTGHELGVYNIIHTYTMVFNTQHSFDDSQKIIL